LSVEDARDFYGLNLDQEVLKYTGDKPFENIKTAKDFLINYDQYERYRVGRLAVIEKKTLKFIGWCGLNTIQTQINTTSVSDFSNSTGIKVLQQKLLKNVLTMVSMT
jgi:hypothetical protein